MDALDGKFILISKYDILCCDSMVHVLLINHLKLGFWFIKVRKECLTLITGFLSMARYFDILSICQSFSLFMCICVSNVLLLYTDYIPIVKVDTDPFGIRFTQTNYFAKYSL